MRASPLEYVSMGPTRTDRNRYVARLLSIRSTLEPLPSLIPPPFPSATLRLLLYAYRVLAK